MKFVKLAALIAAGLVAASVSGCSGGPGASGGSDQDQIAQFKNNKTDWTKMTPAEKSQLKKQPDGSWTFHGFPVSADNAPPANFNPSGN